MSREYEEGLKESHCQDLGQSMRLPVKGHILKLEVLPMVSVDLHFIEHA